MAGVGSPRLALHAESQRDGWRRIVGRRFRRLFAELARPTEATRGSAADRAFVARMRAAGNVGWPEAMTRELQACETPAAWRTWSEKWAVYLSGQVQRSTRDVARPQPL